MAQFKIIDMRLGVVDNGGKAEIIVHFKRIFCFYIYTMFIPSLCVVVTAELTLFVDEVSVMTFKNNRFTELIELQKHFEASVVVALTSMLVMHTLYNNLEQRLPIDSNFKLIDFWLMHGLYTPFLVFCVHITAKLKRQSDEEKVQDHQKKNKLPPKIREPKCRGPLMRLCSIVIPATSICFVLIFFVVAVSVY